MQKELVLEDEECATDEELDELVKTFICSGVTSRQIEGLYYQNCEILKLLREIRDNNSK